LSKSAKLMESGNRVPCSSWFTFLIAMHRISARCKQEARSRSVNRRMRRTADEPEQLKIHGITPGIWVHKHRRENARI